MSGGGGGGEARVSIPNNARKVIQEVKKTLGSKHSEEFVYTTLKDCDMDPNEAGLRLKMIQDIREIAGKHSVEDVYTMLKECSMDPNEAAQRLLYIDTFHEVKKKQDRRKTINSDVSEEYARTRRNQWRGAKGGRGTFCPSKAFDDDRGGRNLNSGKEFGVTRVSRLTMPVHSGKENNVVHVAKSAGNVNGTPAISNGSCIHKLISELSADVSSSTSDTVVVSSQNNKHICAVGTIKCEIVKRSESNGRIPAGMKFSADQVGAAAISVIAEAADSIVAEKNQISESLQPLLSLTQNSSHVVNPNLDKQPSQLLNEPPKVTAPEHMTVSITNIHLVPEEESESKISAPKHDLLVEKLTLSSHQPVIFPDYLKVPENYKSQFTFGSLDTTPDDCNPLSVIESTLQNGEVVTKPSLSNQNVSTTTQEGVFQDHPPPHLSDNVLPSQDNISSEPALKDEHAKVEMMPPINGFHNPVLQTTRDYSYGFMPHLMGPHFVQLDVPELQNGSSLVASALGPTPATQPTMAGQSSITLSPPLFPYFRQPYPNYIPYNPYFPHMYLPQNAHLLNHGVFPTQQPPTGNGHMQAGVKLASNEDVTAASQAKDNNIYPPVQQGDDLKAWAPAAGQDVPNLLPNYFYNFPPQHMAFSPFQAGIYHSPQTMTAQSSVQPETTGGPVEPMVQPPTSYQQTQHDAPPQINWNNTALLNKETS